MHSHCSVDCPGGKIGLQALMLTELYENGIRPFFVKICGSTITERL